MVKIDEVQIDELEDDDNSKKKPTFRYRRLNCDGRKKSIIERPLSVLKKWSLLCAFFSFIVGPWPM